MAVLPDAALMIVKCSLSSTRQHLSESEGEGNHDGYDTHAQGADRAVPNEFLGLERHLGEGAVEDIEQLQQLGMQECLTCDSPAAEANAASDFDEGPNGDGLQVLKIRL